VAFTSAEARRAEVAVVVDVLRAGSTIVAAFEGGFRRAPSANSSAPKAIESSRSGSR